MIRHAPHDLSIRAKLAGLHEFTNNLRRIGK